MRILSTLRGLLRQTPVTNGRLEGDMDANGQRIVNVGEPTLDDDAATKKYVDDHGGGGGTIDYNRLNNKPSINGKTLQGAVLITGNDIKTWDDPEAETVTDKIDSDYETLMEHIGDTTGNPHHVNAADVGAYTTDQVDGLLANKANSSDVYGKEDVDFKLSDKADKDELRVTMTLVGNDPYTVQLDGETLTFAQIKAYAQTRNAVIQRGQGTYRVTYIGATEMMWDVTGTVQGDVLTGQIHIFDQDGVAVVQRVAPKTLATAAMAQYPIKAVVNGQLLDRTINTSTGGAFTFPASGTGARDFVVVVAASSTAPSVSFPSSGVTYFSDDDAVWTAEADKVNIWYFTEIAANQFMVAHKALAQTAQA